MTNGPEPERDDAGSPVSSRLGEERLTDGMALCLSGGGYRAMLFHVGSLWRLNELGVLARLQRISSVSGGSITAATLGRAWAALEFDAAGVARNLGEEVVAPVRRLAGRTIDVPAVLGGLLSRGVADRVARAYRRHLFGDATLQDLPDSPRFVINATNLQTGALWRFSKPYMADYRVGVVPTPTVPLAAAVAASSAFPPVLSPVRLGLQADAFDPDRRGPLHTPPFTTRAVLSDGGVYDNLGLETAWKRYRTVLISDGGGQMQPAGDVPGSWIRQAVRVNSVIDNQVRDLRKRQAVGAFRRGERDGAYWGIRSAVADYGPPTGSLPCPPEATAALAAVPTRLSRTPASLQEQLINWGYAVTDVAVRTWVLPEAPPPAGFPYAATGIG